MSVCLGSNKSLFGEQFYLCNYRTKRRADRTRF